MQEQEEIRAARSSDQGVFEYGEGDVAERDAINITHENRQRTQAPRPIPAQLLRESFPVKGMLSFSLEF